MAVHGTRDRESVSWDYAGVLQVLTNVARDHTGLPLLRCYWYEATVDGHRRAEHDTLADLPGVKLRLGRMRRGHREGVESEIHRDLTTLARNRAISDALVVSAAEDLTQVIAEVQDLGIRVVLVHIGAPGRTAPAALRQECDDSVEIGAAYLRPSVELVAGAEPVSEEERQALYASRAPANGHGQPGVIGQPPAAASASGPPAAGQSRAGENGLASPAPGGPGLAAAPPPAPPRAASLPGMAGPPAPRPTMAGPSALPGPHAAAGHHPAPSRPALPPAGQLAQGQPPVQASGPAPLPPRTQPARAGGQHAGPPSPLTDSVPAVPGQHTQHAPPPWQLAPGQPAPGRPLPPPGQAAPVPAYHAAPPPPAAPLPAAPPAALPAPAQPARRGQVPDVAAARQAAATPRPPTVGAPPGPARDTPSGAPAAPPVQPGQPLQQPRGYPAGPPGPVTSGPGDQRAGHFPVTPGQPGAGVAAPYAPDQGPDTEPQPAAQYGLVPEPVGAALADAVQAAHGEGFSFGQAVARDAPALWLEAVLARKPRMPSDLEARLLQDSSLPIDSLLHEQVRHALRRGFWDALERVRR